ncbi:MAG: PRC-barrel domain-containing protein [Gemmatimonadaceae bacterium]|nr:PRC-barrel domain-containing protein [Gemmatimonadaceae bacterium]
MSELIVPKNARPVDSSFGAPLEPIGNPLSAGIGPGAWAERADRPDLTLKGAPRIVPMRVATDFYVAHEDPDPRGLEVRGMDGVAAGTVVDLWVDRSEPCLRYIEMELSGGGRRLLPVPFLRVPRPDTWLPLMTKEPSATHVQINVLKGADFAGIPVTKHPDLVTLLEEDKISAYFGAGSLWNSDVRFGPLV